MRMPFVIVGIMVGFSVHRKLRHASFKRVVGLALAVVGVLVVLPTL